MLNWSIEQQIVALLKHLYNASATFDQ